MSTLRLSVEKLLLFGALSGVGSIGSAAYGQSDHAVSQEFSVIGTIHGGDSPTLRDTVVLLDLKSGKTHVLSVGQCLPRLPQFCLRAIGDKTATIDNSEEQVELGRIDGAV